MCMWSTPRRRPTPSSASLRLSSVPSAFPELRQQFFSNPSSFNELEEGVDAPRLLLTKHPSRTRILRAHRHGTLPARSLVAGRHFSTLTLGAHCAGTPSVPQSRLRPLTRVKHRQETLPLVPVSNIKSGQWLGIPQLLGRPAQPKQAGSSLPDSGAKAMKGRPCPNGPAPSRGAEMKPNSSPSCKPARKPHSTGSSRTTTDRSIT